MPDTAPARGQLDRPILVSNLVSGGLWLSLLAFLSWPLIAIGAPFVVAGAVFLAAVYGRRVLTRRQEVLAWTAPWLVAVVLWSLVIVSIDFENTVSHYLSGLYVGVLIATPAYLGWQIVALAIRQFMGTSTAGSLSG